MIPVKVAMMIVVVVPPILRKRHTLHIFMVLPRTADLICRYEAFTVLPTARPIAVVGTRFVSAVVAVLSPIRIRAANKSWIRLLITAENGAAQLAIVVFTRDAGSVKRLPILLLKIRITETFGPGFIRLGRILRLLAEIRLPILNGCTSANLLIVPVIP